MKERNLIIKKTLSILGAFGLASTGARHVMSIENQEREIIETQLPFPIAQLIPEFEIEQYYASLAIGQVMNQMITILKDKTVKQFYSAKLEFIDSKTNEIILSVFDDNNDSFLNLWNQIYSIDPSFISSVIYSFNLEDEIIYENLSITMNSESGSAVSMNESLQRIDLNSLPNKDQLNLKFTLEI